MTQGRALSCTIPAGESFTAVVGYAKLAEALGYDSINAPHIAARDSFTLLAGLAMRTERIALGAAVAPIYHRSPPPYGPPPTLPPDDPRRSKRMSTFVWILQIVLAVGFLMAGAMKLTQPRAKLAPQMGWVEDFSDTQVKAIGAVEIAAALGLILPAATDIAPVLTPLAAAGLVVVMISAAATHLRRHEAQFIAINATLLTLAAIVAWARFGPYSF